MSRPDSDSLVYPNPGAGKQWTDQRGRTSDRRGAARLDAKRTRALLRRPGTAMATWWAGEVVFYNRPDEKRAAAERLDDAAEHPDDVVASEWRAGDGTVLLLLEHRC